MPQYEANETQKDWSLPIPPSKTASRLHIRQPKQLRQLLLDGSHLCLDQDQNDLGDGRSNKARDFIFGSASACL